ncbi:hypothetical protein [Salinigranum halophilum]|jgi:hypothetical protein|uniref:hypothetical protein n=1 Tax=Salinigranum halophilum TaxID=2565931 RepID=UPI0010A7A87C|nr:hypothetical protein [Salinigranum halophilum]
MDERSGQFRVYRVIESVPHINVQSTESPVLYSVYQSGYADDALEATVDDLRTGDLVEATLVGDAGDETDPWRFEAVERVGRVRTSFAVDAEPPATARDSWTPGQTEPSYTVLEEDGTPVGVCVVQPRSPLPSEALVPSVLSGLVPLESEFASVPELGRPAVEAVFVDPDPPEASSHSVPYGVVYLFTDAGTSTAERLRRRYDCELGTDSRPEYNPYGI